MSCKLKLINTTAGGEASCLPQIPQNLEEVCAQGLGGETVTSSIKQYSIHDTLALLSLNAPLICNECSAQLLPSGTEKMGLIQHSFFFFFPFFVAQALMIMFNTFTGFSVS